MTPMIPARRLLLAALLILLLLFTVPLFAQESTSEPPTASTLEGAPIALVTPSSTQAAAPVAIDMGSGSGNVTVITGATPTAPTPPANSSSGLLSLTVGEVMAIVIGTLALFSVIGKALWDGNQPGASLDTRLTQGIETAQHNQAYIDALAQAYANGIAAMRQAVDSSISVLQIIAPQTGLKLDDATLALLKQIQQTGQSPTDGSASSFTPPSVG